LVSLGTVAWRPVTSNDTSQGLPATAPD
jgi:hypothetical protein